MITKDLILLDNLLDRFEFNERTDTYVVRGSITVDERKALQNARNAYQEKIDGTRDR